MVHGEGHVSKVTLEVGVASGLISLTAWKLGVSQPSVHRLKRCCVFNELNGTLHSCKNKYINLLRCRKDFPKSTAYWGVICSFLLISAIQACKTHFFSIYAIQVLKMRFLGFAYNVPAAGNEYDYPNRNYVDKS